MYDFARRIEDGSRRGIESSARCRRRVGERRHVGCERKVLARIGVLNVTEAFRHGVATVARRPLGGPRAGRSRGLLENGVHEKRSVFVERKVSLVTPWCR